MQEDVSILMKHAPAINNILEILINNQERIFGVVFYQKFFFFLSNTMFILHLSPSGKMPIGEQFHSFRTKTLIYDFKANNRYTIPEV